jgi:hypothetical protein
LTAIFEELVDARCNEALEECEIYLEKEYGGTLSEIELRIEAERIVYKRAVKDVVEALKFFKII